MSMIFHAWLQFTYSNQCEGRFKHSYPVAPFLRPKSFLVYFNEALASYWSYFIAL
ncbi:MAG: hypothetical protein ACFFE4_19710 [Candidatus Thorarchaeota archaeon]